MQSLHPDEAVGLAELGMLFLSRDAPIPTPVSGIVYIPELSTLFIFVKCGDAITPIPAVYVCI